MARSLGMGAGLVAPPAPTPPLTEQEEENLLETLVLEFRKIRKRVAPPIYERIIPINLASGATGDIDTMGNEVNAIIVDVLSGTLQLWLSTDAGSTAVPPYTFTAVGTPVQLLIPLRERHFSWQASGATVATLTIQAN
jgi:hypothetical protein